jgi:hypothetical protein
VVEGWNLRFQALRAAQAANAPEVLQANWRWNLALWTEGDRREWARVMAQARKQLLDLNPELRGRDY